MSWDTLAAASIVAAAALYLLRFYTVRHRRRAAVECSGQCGDCPFAESGCTPESKRS